MPCVRGLQAEWHSVVKVHEGKPSRCLAESAMSNVENALSHTVRMREEVTLSPPSACVLLMELKEEAGRMTWLSMTLCLFVSHFVFSIFLPHLEYPRFLLHHIISRRHIRPRLSQPECPLRLAKTTSPVCALERRTVVITESALDSKPNTRLPFLSSATQTYFASSLFFHVATLQKRTRSLGSYTSSTSTYSR